MVGVVGRRVQAKKWPRGEGAAGGNLIQRWRLLDDDVVGPVPHLCELLFERLNFIGIGGQDNTVVLVLGSR